MGTIHNTKHTKDTDDTKINRQAAKEFVKALKKMAKDDKKCIFIAMSKTVAKGLAKSFDQIIKESDTHTVPSTTYEEAAKLGGRE